MYTYKYPRPALTADCLVVGIGNDGGRFVLLVKRGHEPYEGCWALPGGFMEMEETLEACAQRELAEETGYDGLPTTDVGELSRWFKTRIRKNLIQKVNCSFLIVKLRTGQIVKQFNRFFC